MTPVASIPRSARNRGLRAVLLGACVLALAACHAPTHSPASDPSFETDTIERTLDTLYRSFCFDAGAEPDWQTMRSLAIDGACWTAPVAADATPRAVATDEFVRDFRTWVQSSPDVRSGLHERIVALRVDGLGTIAHAFVTFEGFVPGQVEARTRGVDSIQLVRAGESWKVASFTTQYEARGTQLPERFLRPPRP